MKKHTLYIKFWPHGRGIEDCRIQSYQPDKQLWSEAKNVLGVATYDTPYGEVKIKLELSTLQEKMLELIEYDVTANPAISIQRLFEPVEVECRVYCSQKFFSVVEIVRHYLENLFLITNISVPGSCNLYKTEISSKELERFEKVSLSQDIFESFWTSQTSWPQINIIPLSRVNSWFEKLNLGVTQCARTPIELALFSILRASSMDDVGPDRIIWLSQALESLCDIRGGPIMSTLLSRLNLLLSPPHINDKKWLKKSLTEFYGVRSRFVHGDFPIFRYNHANECLDPKVASATIKLIRNMDFGAILTIAIMQKFAIEEWHAVNFRETAQGLCTPAKNTSKNP